MRLHVDERGDGRPVLLLHGLFGSSANWRSFAKRLATTHRVLSVDLRSHGRSPHARDHGYPALAADIEEVLKTRDLASATIVGHSMGGKAAMQLALSVPRVVERLVVIDIAARKYRGDERWIVDALLDVRIASAGSRAAVESALGERIADAELRSFLLMGVVRDGDGGFAWRFNLEALASEYDKIIGPVMPEKRYDGPTLLVRGGRSDYVTDADVEQMRGMFPAIQVAMIADAGHWVHMDAADELLDVIRAFVDGGAGLRGARR